MPGPSNKAMYSYENGYMFYGDGRGNITEGNEYLKGGFFLSFNGEFEEIAEDNREDWTYELPLELLL